MSRSVLILLSALAGASSVEAFAPTHAAVHLEAPLWGLGPEIDPGIITMDGQPNIDEDMELSEDIEPSEDSIPDQYEI